MNVLLWPFAALGAGGLWTAYQIAPERLYDALLGIAHRTARLKRHERYVLGHRVTYFDGGEVSSARAPLILLHDLTTDWVSWLPCLRFLTRDHRVIVLDLPGFGESERHADASYDVRSQSERLHALIDALGIDRAHLLGNSMGGQIAAFYSATHPERVDSLTLLAPTGVQTPNPSEVELMVADGEASLVPKTVEAFERLFALSFVQPPPVPSRLFRCYAERTIEHSDFLEKIWNDLVEEYVDLTPLLPQIKAPTLVLWGEHDRIIDVSAARVFLDRLPDATLVYLQSCGHAPQAERPTQFVDHFLEFLGDSGF